VRAAAMDSIAASPGVGLREIVRPSPAERFAQRVGRGRFRHRQRRMIMGMLVER